MIPEVISVFYFMVNYSSLFKYLCRLQMSNVINAIKRLLCIFVVLECKVGKRGVRNRTRTRTRTVFHVHRLGGEESSWPPGPPGPPPSEIELQRKPWSVMSQVKKLIDGLCKHFSLLSLFLIITNTFTKNESTIFIFNLVLVSFICSSHSWRKNFKNWRGSPQTEIYFQ